MRELRVRVSGHAGKCSMRTETQGGGRTGVRTRPAASPQLGVVPLVRFSLRALRAQHADRVEISGRTYKCCIDMNTSVLQALRRKLLLCLSVCVAQ